MLLFRVTFNTDKSLMQIIYFCITQFILGGFFDSEFAVISLMSIFSTFTISKMLFPEKPSKLNKVKKFGSTSDSENHVNALDFAFRYDI